MKPTLLRAVLVTTLSATTGCTAISFSAVGSLADLGNSAVSFGNDKYYFGKLTTAEMADPDTARVAMFAAATDLGLYLKAPGDYDDGDENFAFLDERGMQIGVEIQRRSASLVRIKVDVGAFGNEVTARLFLARMRCHLPSASGPFVEVHPATAPVK
jgi:hypothetical protein